MIPEMHVLYHEGWIGVTCAIDEANTVFKKDTGNSDSFVFVVDNRIEYPFFHWVDYQEPFGQERWCLQVSQ